MLPYLPDWPAVTSAIARDDRDEAFVADLVDRMTLEEKVGQMIQPELFQLTAEDVQDYKIGSALNGAGVWPGGDRYATPETWRKTIRTFREAAERAYEGRGFRIPLLWATDAVHGHGNAHGATIFPHNVGLGAADDPALIERIGRATAREIAATGMEWTYAPTVTTPRDRRWGRYYEGYSEDPEIVARYAAAMVRGLQGDAAGLRAGRGVLATVKHWVADGATEHGADRGVARCSEDLLRNVHAAGFLSGIEAGAQAVMASFSSWENPANYDHTPGRDLPFNHKVHGSRYLIHDVLKQRIGFDGIVISDWDAHGEVSGCTIGDGGYAFLAGLDVLMVTSRAAWQSVWHTTIAQVRAGVIPMSRIDDAVTRVLRVKVRAGLFDQAERAEPGALGGAAHAALAREAAAKSLVLLKHAGDALPLAADARVLVTGSAAADLRKLTGGWTLSWQGDELTAADLPGMVTVADALAERRTITTDPADDYDVAVVVIGEDPYAEMRGTIKPWRSIGYADLKRSYAADRELLRRLRADGRTVVTVMLTGRPLYVTEEINLSDAFVVAWLPGTQGGPAIAAALCGDTAFTGTLAHTWPARRGDSAVNRAPAHVPGYRPPPEEQDREPLFGYGFGRRPHDGGPLPVDDTVDDAPVPPADGPIDVSGPGFAWTISGHHTWSGVPVRSDAPVSTMIVDTRPVPGPGGRPALAIRFHGHPALVYARPDSGVVRDLRGYADGRLRFGIRVVEPPAAPLLLACHDDYPGQPGLDLTPLLAGTPVGEWTVLEVAPAAFAGLGMDLRHVDVPFMLYCDGPAAIELSDVIWTPVETH